MKKILAILAMLCLLPLTLVAVTTSSATASGCGDTAHLTTAVSTGTDNLLINGRPVKFTLHVDKKDCDGYDLVTDVWGTIHKDNGNCKSPWARTDGYKLNPNVLGDDNPPTQFVDCVGDAFDGTRNYIVFWNVYEKINSSMTVNERCIGMHAVVDLVLHTNPTYDTPSLCFNGK